MPSDLDARVEALEGRTAGMSIGVKALIKDVAEIKGRIGQMPTIFPMRAWVALGLVALIFTVARAVK